MVALFPGTAVMQAMESSVGPVLQATESWAGPGNEAWEIVLQKHWNTQQKNLLFLFKTVTCKIDDALRTLHVPK